MVGAPLYPDNEIEWLLELIINGENASSIRAKFEDKFGRPLRKNQVRYIKNKYGKDPRFNSPLINRRPKKRARARATRSASGKKNYKEDSDDEDVQKRRSKLAQDQDDDDAIQHVIVIDNIEEEIKTSLKYETEDKETACSISQPRDSLLATSTASPQKPKHVDAIIGDDLFIDPALSPATSTWPGGLTSTVTQSGFPNMLSPCLSAPMAANIHGLTGCYAPSGQWNPQQAGWNLQGPTQGSPLSQGLGFQNNMGQFFQPALAQNLQNRVPDLSNGLMSNYPLPMSPTMDLPYPNQFGLQNFSGLTPAQQNHPLGPVAPQVGQNIQVPGLGYPMPLSETLLLNIHQQSLAIPPELAAPSPHQQQFNLPSIQSVIGGLSSPAETAQVMQPNQLAPGTTGAWNGTQWTPGLPMPAAQTPVSEPGWDTLLTPMLYAPPASNNSSQPSPELTQPIYAEPSIPCLSGTHLPCSLPYLGTSEVLYTGHNASAVATSLDVEDHLWYMHEQALEDADVPEEHTRKVEMPLLGQPYSFAKEHEQTHCGHVIDTIDPRLIDGPDELLSPISRLGSVITDSHGEDGEDEDEDEIFPLEEELQHI